LLWIVNHNLRRTTVLSDFASHANVFTATILPLVFDSHRVRIDGLLTCNAFKSGDYAAVVILVALHGEAAFRIAG
jgi:hypothetical protein